MRQVWGTYEVKSPKYRRAGAGPSELHAPKLRLVPGRALVLVSCRFDTCLDTRLCHVSDTCLATGDDGHELTVQGISAPYPLGYQSGELGGGRSPMIGKCAATERLGGDCSALTG